jgi:hypothetical protein
MDIKIIKKLGSGVNGTVYLAESNREKYIYKIEKYEPEASDVKFIHCYDRQVDFDKKVAQKYPNKFMSLKSHGIIEHCNHKQPIPNWAKGKFRKELVAKNKFPSCYFLLYQPILKYTFADVRDKIHANDQLYFKVMYQVIEQVNIIKMAGFRHADIHSGNIMSDGTNFRIIDYGQITHKNYPKNKEDKEFDKIMLPSDLVLVLLNLAIINPIYDYIFKNKLQLPKFETFLKRINNYSEVRPLNKYLQKNLTKEDRRELLAFLVTIFHYDIYKICLGFGDKKYEKYKIELSPVRLNFLKYCVKHVADTNYSCILRYINRLA